MNRVETMLPSVDLVERFIVLPTGVRLQYVEQGNGGGVPVVFLHGVTDSWRSFEPVLPYLPPTIHAFALSQRGHGNSSRPHAGYTYTDMSEDLRAFLAAVNVPAAVIVGHSMGSMVAQRFAIDYPGRVKGLVLVGAFASMYQRADMEEYTATVIAGLTDPVDPEVARDFQVSTLAHEVAPEFLDTVVRESLKVPARIWRATFESFLATPAFYQALTAVSPPTRMIWGDRDAYARRTDQEVLLGAIPGSRLTTYEGTGHAVHWEEPVRFAQEVSRFVLELTDAPA